MAKGNLVIPKFRFENAVLIVAVRFFRWTFFLLYGLAIGWINTHPLPPNSFNFAGNLKYLTYWNLIAQFALYSLINYCDIFLSNNDRAIVSRANVLTKLRDLLHQGVAFPVGMVRLINRKASSLIICIILLPVCCNNFLDCLCN